MRWLEAKTKRIADDLEYDAPEIRKSTMILKYHRLAWDFADRALRKAGLTEEQIKKALAAAEVQS